VFSALGDETRLLMLERVLSNEPCTVGLACEGLDLTRQGARRHLQILIDADLVQSEAKGRLVVLTSNPQTVADAKGYLEGIERFWTHKLSKLKAHVENDV
jgi:DNA-binding transcriptional ArsR family regulator